MEKSGIYTQLYHTITVDDNQLEFRSYTVTGELYDAFDLLKREGETNQLVERM